MKKLLAPTDLFVIKHDKSGNKIWTRLLGVPGEYTVALGIDVDSSGTAHGYAFVLEQLKNMWQCVVVINLAGKVDLYTV